MLWPLGLSFFESALGDYPLDVSYVNAKSGHFIRKFVGHIHHYRPPSETLCRPTVQRSSSGMKVMLASHRKYPVERKSLLQFAKSAGTNSVGVRLERWMEKGGFRNQCVSVGIEAASDQLYRSPIRSGDGDQPTDCDVINA